MSPATALSADEARRLRQQSLLLAPAEHPAAATTDPGTIVEWFGAMQAQDVASGHWSFGVRLPGSTNADIDRATAERQIVRTWPMRGTIHFVPPPDVNWLLELTGARMLRGVERRWQILGLDRRTVEAAADAIGATLADGPLTRAQVLASLQAQGIDASGQRGYHLLWFASQTGVSVIGPQRGKEQTFALAADWLPPQRELDRDEALRTLAERFFRSHGPAALTDFTGWTGLTATDTKAAVAMLGDKLAQVAVGERALLCSAAALDAPGWRDEDVEGQGAGAGVDEPLVLPGFDEYLLGYKDRWLAADADAMAAVIPGGNGVFRNTVTIAGQVKATWTRTTRATRAKRIDITVLPLPRWRPTKAVRARVERAFKPYGEFLGLPVTVTFG